ncbi:MAG: hypothetical protein AAFN91_10210 [Pseudomonadota bacterium]
MDRPIKLTGKNRALLRKYVSELKSEVDALGYGWEPSFESVVETVRRNKVREGDQVRSFDEVAYYMLLGCLGENYGSEWVDKFEAKQEFE